MHFIPLPLLPIRIDWVMKETTLGTKAGIKWTFTETLDDLDFADDIALLAHRYGDIQGKANARTLPEMLENCIKDKHQQNKGTAKQQPNSRSNNNWRTYH